MRLVTAFITFMATLGAIFLFENSHNQKPPSDYGQIIQALKQQATPASVVKQAGSPIKTPTKSPVKSFPTISVIPTPAADENISFAVKNPAPLPTPLVQPAETAGPAPTVDAQETRPPVSTAHIFYTSSHWKAKYYYCDTDKEWEGLSEKYLKSFGSETELLRNYNRILHKPCE